MRRARRVSASGDSSVFGTPTSLCRASDAPERHEWATVRHNDPIMIGFTLLLFPFVLLGFVMLMGRVEEPLSQVVGRARDRDLPDEANKSEMDAFVREGTDSALRRFRNRLRPRRAQGLATGLELIPSMPLDSPRDCDGART